MPHLASPRQGPYNHLIPSPPLAAFPVDRRREDAGDDGTWCSPWGGQVSNSANEDAALSQPEVNSQLPDTPRRPAGPVDPAERLCRPRPGILFVLSGPSGVGKDAVIARLKHSGVPLHYTVTCTTRSRRPGEEDGVAYHFVDQERFERMYIGGELLECANVHGYHYGTPLAQVREALAAGNDVLLKIDVQGAAQVKRRAPDAVFIFLAPPGMNELIARLAQRQTESAQEMETRIANAYEEMKHLPEYDYVVVNYADRLGEAVSCIKAIITAEGCRVTPRRIEL